MTLCKKEEPLGSVSSCLLKESHVLEGFFLTFLGLVTGTPYGSVSRPWLFRSWLSWFQSWTVTRTWTSCSMRTVTNLSRDCG